MLIHNPTKKKQRKKEPTVHKQQKQSKPSLKPSAKPSTPTAVPQRLPIRSPPYEIAQWQSPPCPQLAPQTPQYFQQYLQHPPNPIFYDPPLRPIYNCPPPPYYAAAPAVSPYPPAEKLWKTQFKAASTANLPKAIPRPVQAKIDDLQQWTRKGADDLQQLKQKGTDYYYQSTAAYDLIASKFDAVMTSIDGEMFSGREEELYIFDRPETEPALRGGWGITSNEISRAANKVGTGVVTSPKSTNYFAKVNLYANSRLPAYLPPLKLYLPSYPLICLAAQFSERVYTKPQGKEKATHVDADWKMGTKAMVVKSVPIDDMDAVVIAIRGSQTFMDWAVNLKSAPSPPTHFLDDTGNLCHSGFLSVARKMIKPVAARLRAMLEEEPGRSTCSLILTGHSAGGAVASLLFAHLMAEEATSELKILTGCFKRLHCITFGTPPISLLPIRKSQHQRFRKSLFLSFINEGDPVARADKAYVRSLLDLYTRPPPNTPCPILTSIPNPVKLNLNPLNILKPSRPKPLKSNSAPAAMPSVSIWRMPPGTLSNAGRLVVLRHPPPIPGGKGALGGSGSSGEDDIVAQIVGDQELRNAVFGDPVVHTMQIYRRRVEILATKAVTGGGTWS